MYQIQFQGEVSWQTIPTSRISTLAMSHFSHKWHLPLHLLNFANCTRWMLNEKERSDLCLWCVCVCGVCVGVCIESEKGRERWNIILCVVRMFQENVWEIWTENGQCRWQRVMDFYLGGISGKRADWIKATELLQECLQMRPDDGPCHTILKYIQSTGEVNYNEKQALCYIEKNIT